MVLQEKGLLGIRLEKTTRHNALEGLDTQASADLTEIASVASNVILEYPDQLATLKYEINGIPDERVKLDGGRQIYKKNILTIKYHYMQNLFWQIITEYAVRLINH